MNKTTVVLNPGGLLNVGETLIVKLNEPGTVSLHHLHTKQLVSKLNPISTNEYKWICDIPGSYTLTLKTTSETITRYIGVVDKNWAVCQMTVGAFTAEDFDSIFHNSVIPVPADYYICVAQFADPKWRKFECFHGDAIHPHVHANDFAAIDSTLAHEDPNWDSLSVKEIVFRLRALLQYWQGLGFEPLNRIATYAPCNKFIEACRITGIRILHSIIPEQNWSDSEWAINHWGMPTCPFWIAQDDFRKPTTRTSDGVLAMTMNHYQILLPHLTHWGDFVLSPSHFCRWNRSCDSGQQPVRFRQFASDTIANAAANPSPLFFVAGFEFGRTFGTGKMTDFNINGIKTLIRLSADTPLVFATSRDVFAYYQRHIQTFSERALLQRDNWAGARTMGKPGVADDSVVIERAEYKALIREDNPLPWFHYDYQTQWNYPTAATDVPYDYSPQDRSELSVIRSEDQITIKAGKPLSRTIPIVAWDAKIDKAPFLTTKLANLDDNRNHTLLEVPKGWQGNCQISIKSQLKPTSALPSWWQTKTFDTGDHMHTYLHLDLPLLRDVQIPIELLKPTSVDGAQAPIGFVPAGKFVLTLGPHRTWHRFWGINGVQLRLTQETIEAVSHLQLGVDVLGDNWQSESQNHCRNLHQAMLLQFNISENQVVLATFCGANLPLGSRSRSAQYDVIHSKFPSLTAQEHGDGALCYGPGKNFWIHPCNLPFKVRGLDKLVKTNQVSIVLNSFDARNLGAKYIVTSGTKPPGNWQLPTDPFDCSAWYHIDIDQTWLDARGTLRINLRTDQKQVLYDWWQERGFVAGLHAIWVIAKR